jgi:lysophospholipase L1-like esterase
MTAGAGLKGSAAWGLALFTCAIFVTTQPAQAQDTQCAAPLEAQTLEHAPIHFRERIAKGLPLKIVAIGSSSTFGTGASSPAMTYPARLEAELKARFPGLPITVLNKGIGGEEAPQMLARFEADVFEEAPDLVLWQVGSNSVLRDHPAPGETIREGVERLKASGSEVILMNPQYAPKIIDKGPEVDQAVDTITATARDLEVGVFNRFVAMRYWRETEHLPFEQFVTADGLHMNDWGYGCIAHLLATAIVDQAQPPTATATAKVSAGPSAVK